MSDVFLTQLAMTAPSSAPATWDHYMVVGPEGVAIEVDVDGPVTLTKQGVAVATVELTAAGGIALTPAAGQTVKAGTTTSPVIKSALLTALDAFRDAVPVPNDGGAAIQNAFKIAYAIVRPTLETEIFEAE
jgi:hypothetical protein